MPESSQYSYTGPVDHTIPPNKSLLRNKSIIVTGGANGMGEELVKQFAASGSYVTFCDINEARGKQVENEILQNGGKAKFILCDTTSWEDQVQMFDAAIANSPDKSCDVVIANAGISRSSGDSLWKLDDPEGLPTKPTLNIVNVNLNGTLFTFKLAVHYFRKQAQSQDRDRCFIMTGSMTTYIDSPVQRQFSKTASRKIAVVLTTYQGNWEYTCTKYALRGLMRTVRRSSGDQGIRINYVAPCYIKSAIRTAETERRLLDKGVEFGYPEDVAACMMRIATDQTINGHSLAIVPRSVAREGYMDAQQDDYTEDGYFKRMQEIQSRVIEDRWVD